MPNFLDDLLNPAPASGAVTPHPEDATTDGVTEATFAPELFQSDPAELAALAANATSTLENGLLHEAVDPTTSATGQNIEQANGTGHDESQYPAEGLETQITDDHDAMDVDTQQEGQSQGKSASPQAEKKPKSRKRYDPDNDPRSTVHSSKNEGQHTDKRYLCYVCNKLFTRRRSVRDHMSKIHGSKAFEPTRSLEITVDPITGEPLEPLDDIIARGPAPAPDKPVKSAKKEKGAKAEDPDAMDQNMAVADKEGRPPDRDLDLGDFPQTQREASNGPIRKDAKVEGTPAPEIKTEARPSPQPTAHVTIAGPTMAGKKRPAPEPTKPLPAAITKKGTARPKASGPVAKKPRLTEVDSTSDRSTPLRSPSATPLTANRLTSSKLKKQLTSSSSPASSRVASVEPQSPSPSAAETPGSSNDDGEVFCICRKGDNHTWMIACDGVCNEWYHGKCVNIRERDGDLIDKYICPACTSPDFMTTWKRMCRRQDCRKPAKVFQDPPSKYCSKECGRMFFVELLRRGDPFIETIKHDQYVVNTAKPKKLRKKRKTEKRDKRPTRPADAIEESDSRLATPAYSEDEKSEYETDSSADEDDLVNRGTSLGAAEVRAVADQCKSIEAWRNLGRKPATPPPDEPKDKVAMVFDDFERNKLVEIEAQKTENTRRLGILEAREKLLEAIKVRSASITDEVKKSNPKLKEVCGFDPRLAWNEDTFVDWYEKKGGKEILSADKPRIGFPEDTRKPANGDVAMNGVQGESDAESDEGKTTKKGGVCIRNRCTRHRTWIKAQLAEIRFEQDFVKRNVRQNEELEKGLKERAILRALEK